MPDLTKPTEEEDFFAVHGVGDNAVEPAEERLIALLDKSVATHKEKEFVRYIVAGKSQTEAYMRAFDNDNRSSSSTLAVKLMKRKRVLTYYTELLEQRNDLAEETLPKLIEELNEDRQLARDLGQPSAAIQAVKVKANMLGLENKPDNVTMNVNVLSDDAKNQILNRISNKMKDKDTHVIEDAEYKDITPE